MLGVFFLKFPGDLVGKSVDQKMGLKIKRLPDNSGDLACMLINTFSDQSEDANRYFYEYHISCYFSYPLIFRTLSSHTNNNYLILSYFFVHKILYFFGHPINFRTQNDLLKKFAIQTD